MFADAVDAKRILREVRLMRHWNHPCVAMRMTLAKVRCGLLGKMPKARHYSPEMKKGLDGVLAEMEDVAKTINRIYGPSHPYAKEINGMTTFARTLKLEHAPLFRSN